MARPRVKDRKVDMNDQAVNRKVRDWFGTLRGIYKITATPSRPDPEEDKTTRYYFAEVVPAFMAYLNEQEPRFVGKDEAHRELKRHVMGVPVFHPETGEELAVFIPSYSAMDPDRRSEYVTKARAWLLSKLGVPTMDPIKDPAEREQTKRAARAALTNGSPAWGHC